MPAYEALGRRYEVTLAPLAAAGGGIPLPARAARGFAPATTRRVAAPAMTDADTITRAVGASPVLSSRIDPSRLCVVQGAVPGRPVMGSRSAPAVPISSTAVLTMATDTVIAEGLRQDDLSAAKAYGAVVIEEGLDGKLLLRVDSAERAFGLVDILLKREVGSATPNFLRRIVRVRRSAPGTAWAH